MRRYLDASMIVLATVLAVTLGTHDAAARTRNAAAAAAATAPDPDKPDPNSPEAKADKQKRLQDYRHLGQGHAHDAGPVEAHVQELARGSARPLMRRRRQSCPCWP